MLRKAFILACSALALVACGGKKVVTEKAHHPEWTYNTVVYEVNTRQFSPEGTFAGVQAQLPRLKELGVDVLWLMPIYEIGTEGRKGTLGSYYAISDYTATNPEFGTMEDFQSLLDAAHAQGFKVILDWVANQTAPDHVWMTTQPADFYERDSLGNAVWEYDWTDTRSLNYGNEAVWAAQDSCMRFWIAKGVDGFRCDAAGEVPSAFWHGILPKLKADFPELYLLAEAERRDLANPDSTFDATYAWELHHLLNDVAQGVKGVSDLKDYVARDAAAMPRAAFRLMFTSNHDENSWSGSEFERMGAAANVCEVLCFTLPNGQPLVYTGQEVGVTRRIEFFEKDPVTDWTANAQTDFFKTLIAFRHAHPGALSAGERGARISYIEGVPESVLAFSRKASDDEVVVVANLSAEPQDCPLTLDGSYVDAFTGAAFEGETTARLAPWGWLLLSK